MGLIFELLPKLSLKKVFWQGDINCLDRDSILGNPCILVYLCWALFSGVLLNDPYDSNLSSDDYDGSDDSDNFDDSEDPDDNYDNSDDSDIFHEYCDNYYDSDDFDDSIKIIVKVKMCGRKSRRYIKSLIPYP